MNGFACIPLVAHVLCGLGMAFGVAMLLVGTVVSDRSRGYFLMIVGVVSCIAAYLAWYDVVRLTTCT